METQRFHPINFSRRILAWKLADHFDVGRSIAVLLEAGRARATASTAPTPFADSSVENTNASVGELIESGILKRILVMTELNYSNSMIEAWRRL